MVDVLFIGFAIAAWVATAYKVRDLLADPANSAVRALTVGLALLGTAFFVGAPTVYRAADHALGVPNLMRLVSHASLIGFSAAIAVMLVYWVYDPDDARPRVARRWIAFAVGVTVMTVLFIAAPVDQERSDWTVYYGDRPIVVAYLIIYLLLFGSTMWEISRLCRRYTRLPLPTALRRGLKTTAVGSTIGLVYCLYKAGYLLGRASDLSGPDWLGWLGRDDLIAPLLAVPGGLLTVIGLTMPSWAPSIGRVWEHICSYRTYRALYPLWRDLVDAEPEILFGPEPPARPWLRWAELPRLLERRAVEIPDGILRLSPYLEDCLLRHVEAEVRAEGITGAASNAALVGRCLPVALAGRRAGTVAENPAMLPSADAATLEEQLRWLVTVAEAYRRAQRHTSFANNSRARSSR